jgi:UDP-3-O-[3-hydroxymyristoyl] glucosamine N-acyltransferase
MSKTFDQGTIESTLRRLGIAFDRHGEVAGPLAFTSLRAPRPRAIYFLASAAALPSEATHSLVIAESTSDAADPNSGNAFLRVADPQLAFYALMRELVARPQPRGVHPTAIVDPDAEIASDAWIGPYCVIEAGVVIGPGCMLDSHVVLKTDTIMGSNVVIEPHSTVGATGVAWTWDAGGTRRIVQPQTGGVRIGDGVFLGSDVTVVRGSVNENTEIGDSSVVAHGTKIGHGCRIGRLVHMANNVSMAGNVDAGDRTFFGSGCVVHPRVRIANGVVIGAGAVVNRDVEEACTIMGAVTARKVGIHDKRVRGVPAPPQE